MNLKYLILLLFTLLCSCLPESKESEETSTQYSLEDTFDHVFQNQSVECESPSKCPESIAKLVINNGKQIKNCTGFLIEDNIVMTSSKCLKENGFHPSISCHDKIKVFFPETKKKLAQSFNCQNIQSESFGISREDEVLYIQIASTQREFLDKSYEGISNNNRFNIWFVDEVAPNKSVIKKTTCTSRFQTILTPYYNNSQAPFASFSDCQISPHAIGAPIIKQNKVHAVVDESFSTDFFENFEKDFIAFKKNKLPEKMVKASNFSCLKFKDNTIDYPYHCNLIREHPISEKLNTLIDSSLEDDLELAKKLESFSSKIYPQVYHWSRSRPMLVDGENESRDYSQLLVSFQPQCMTKLKGWIDYFKRTVTGLPKEKILNIDIPIFKYNFTLNQYAQIEFELQEMTPSIALEIPLPLKLLKRVQTAQFILKSFHLDSQDEEVSQEIKKAIDSQYRLIHREVFCQ